MDIFAIVSDLTSFGAAGLMGAMWLWERKYSRAREEQIDQAHERIMRDEERLDKLTQVLEQNTAAISRFHEMQREAYDTLKQLIEEIQHDRVR
jgi:uncharacterized protein YigA (DUF484 family)